MLNRAWVFLYPKTTLTLNFLSLVHTSRYGARFWSLIRVSGCLRRHVYRPILVYEPVARPNIASGFSILAQTILKITESLKFISKFRIILNMILYSRFTLSFGISRYIKILGTCIAAKKMPIINN